ncbi:CLK4-ASSOCIATING SERINE/ARGININE RICH PROTEIN [Salix koriyanagi]|uniref:CLK4-ASSOCIATING SERINE/ARGININE RICH PROTEIN n=1 Tax=Salix koriyanagi TaxID=2511006 RepID=A0A9Q0SLZ0_9ROSI|nr:CLK4-ASSOCIATING SERINE/ARGININE RICH PROTEIN [Salix koriyanagi]
MWHEARRSERKVHEMMDAARKRAQRRAVYLAKRRGDPMQSIQVIGNRSRMYRDDGLYQATQDQQGLIPWNGKQDVLIDRFDGRALLDFIREFGTRRHRRRGFTDEEGLQHVHQELEAKLTASFASNSNSQPQPPASKGPYSQVGFSYDGDGKEEIHFSDGDDSESEDDDDDDEDFNSDDSNDEGMETIAKEFGVKRYGWLVYMDKKAKEEVKRQKEVIKGDPAIRKLSRKERRKASQIERERDREAGRITGTKVLHHDPYREPRRSPTYEAYSRSKKARSRSRSYSPSHSRRCTRGRHPDEVHRSKPRTPKIEYITEFGASGDRDEPKREGYSPPPSPPSQADLLNRPSSGHILEALHIDPASGVSLDNDKSTKASKSAVSMPSGLAKLAKASTSGGPLKQQQGEKKETPQERLKRIMSKQLNKQIKKDTAAETAKKQEQERQRQAKLAETSQLSRYRRRSRSQSYSNSPPRRYRSSRSRSQSRSSRRYHSRSRSRSRTRTRSRSPCSRSPRVRSRSRY